MNIEEIRKLSEEKLAHDRQAVVKRPIPETSPREVTADVAAFCAGFCEERPQLIPVVPDKFGLYGWCRDGVIQKIAADGGSAIFGWTVWEWPDAFLTAEFHCVWVSESGDLQDITPKLRGENHIVFVPDHRYAQDFNFDNRPGNKRQRIYKKPDKAPEAKRILATLSGPQLKYETRRAEKAGVSLEIWLERKIPDDPGVKAIDDLISACNEFEEYFDSLGVSGYIPADERLLTLHEKRLKTLDGLITLWKNRGAIAK